MNVYLLVFFCFKCVEFGSKKCGGDLEPPADFPRLRIHGYCAARGAPTFVPSLPCCFEPLAKLGEPNSTHAVIGRAKHAPEI